MKNRCVSFLIFAAIVGAVSTVENSSLAATKDVPSWAQRMPAANPGPREHVALAYDSNVGLGLVFGGYDAAHGPYGDTWAWDGTSWGQAAATGPSARWSHGLAYDASRNVTVLFGGFDFGFLDDTWEWNGAQWTHVCTTAPCATTVPPARRDAAMAYDATRKRVVLFGGSSDGIAALSDTWEWDGSTWQKVCTDAACSPPAARWQSAMTFGGGGVTLFGGVNTVGADLSDVWTWDGTAWSEKCKAAPCSATVPPARHDHAMAYDSRRGRIVLYGGYNGTALADTWEWDFTKWTQSSVTGPSGRLWHGMAFDSGRGLVTVFGGTAGPDTGISETWEYMSKGGACVSDSECDTGHCVDGACCSTASCGTCEACNLDTPGTCSMLTSAPDPDSCSGANACDDEGACKKAAGTSCSDASECATNVCAQGVCCNAGCTGACESCTQSGMLGTCTPLPAGSTGAPACAPKVCDGTSTTCVDAPTPDAGAADAGHHDAGSTADAASPGDAEDAAAADGGEEASDAGSGPASDQSSCAASPRRGLDGLATFGLLGVSLAIARLRRRVRTSRSRS